LNSLAIKRVKPGGILITCSCSFHLADHDFEELLIDVLKKSGRTATVIYRGGQPLDHPWILNRPESKYLKCLALQFQKVPGSF
jgi:23S rRNA (cytosine1962-C5)-methyltransferase